MSPLTARMLLLLCGVLTILLLGLGLFWPSASPPRLPAPGLPLAAPRLPQVSLPAGVDPASVALRGAILNGERIYQRLCFHCHGRQGKGDNNDYMASIGHKPADHTDLLAMQGLSDQEFFSALRDGVKDERGWFTMPPWSSVLTPSEMRDVITYVRRLPLADPASP
ncbi:MAG: cytochrome c [Candidatus Tectimicrobiota bacterium]